MRCLRRGSAAASSNDCGPPEGWGFCAHTLQRPGAAHGGGHRGRSGVTHHDEPGRGARAPRPGRGHLLFSGFRYPCPVIALGEVLALLYDLRRPSRARPVPFFFFDWLTVRRSGMFRSVVQDVLADVRRTSLKSQTVGTSPGGPLPTRVKSAHSSGPSGDLGGPARRGPASVAGLAVRCQPSTRRRAAGGPGGLRSVPSDNQASAPGSIRNYGAGTLYGVGVHRQSALEPQSCSAVAGVSAEPAGNSLHVFAVVVGG